MALLRAKEIAKMNAQERESKRKELQLELIKAQVTAHKTNAKTKEIKRALARIHTIHRLNKIAQEVAKKN
ncbi:50S ribosomal protein L29 [Candidatus Pacearchaeota archaeon]|nr:50S ribosomal protein L29 [Candidatus Pacearchaeota archaeon]